LDGDGHLLCILFVRPLDAADLLVPCLLVHVELGTLADVFFLAEFSDLAEVEFSLANEFVVRKQVFVEHLDAHRVFLLHVRDQVVPEKTLVPVGAAVGAEPVGVRAALVLVCFLLVVLVLEEYLDVGV